jgi:predicted dehydrogenase
LGSHVIDSLQFLTGRKIVAVNGLMRTNVKERLDKSEKLMPVTSDDFSVAQLHFEADLVGTMTVSVITAQKGVHHRFSVSGTEGTLTITDTKLTYFKCGKDGSW